MREGESLETQVRGGVQVRGHDHSGHARQPAHLAIVGLYVCVGLQKLARLHEQIVELHFFSVSFLLYLFSSTSYHF